MNRVGSDSIASHQPELYMPSIPYICIHTSSSHKMTFDISNGAIKKTTAKNNVKRMKEDEQHQDESCCWRCMVLLGCTSSIILERPPPFIKTKIGLGREPGIELYLQFH
mmetsp:Transcript_9998/g.14960  ORF Transcript_9998/g.14960 Transcript_9998/m.14960 type:complete len:109 (+) Transcript_9998:4615-4941(+)